MVNINDVFFREMGLTQREFFRTLPSAVGDHPYRVDKLVIVVEVSMGELYISLSEEKTRRIAAFSLPYLEVKFQFSNVPEKEKNAFMEYFDRRYQRGGG